MLHALNLYKVELRDRPASLSPQQQEKSAIATAYIQQQSILRGLHRRRNILQAFHRATIDGRNNVAWTQSGRGRAEFAIPESGLYKFYFNGSVLGDDTSDSAVYDVSYEILWGVRGAPSGTATAAYPSDQG